MSKFQKRLDSKVRINELEKRFIWAIENYSKEEISLSAEEVNFVLLKMLTDNNNQDLKRSLE